MAFGENQELQPVRTAMGNLIPTASMPLERNPAAVYLASLSPSGRRTQKTALNAIAILLAGEKANAFNCPWGQVRYPHTAAIRSRLVELYAPATGNKMLSALRRVLREAWKLGYISAEDYQRAASVENIKSETLPIGRELSQGEISALMMACNNDRSSAGIRDATTIALLYSCGLRRAEIVGLDILDFDSSTKRFLVRGKRRKERYVYLAEGATEALTDWLHIRGDSPGPLLWPINKRGNIIERRLSTQAIYNILLKRGKEAQVNRFSPHDMRRTFVSDLLDAGADISVVSKMAGHANVQTTARYDRRPEEVKRKASLLLHVPYQRHVTSNAQTDNKG